MREAAAAFAAAGCDPGPVVDAERATRHGLLRWQITVRPDGRRLADGAVPTLIQWGDVHPTSSLPPSGCALVGFDSAGTAGGCLEGWLTPAMAGVDGAGSGQGGRDSGAPDHPSANRMTARSGPHASADDVAAVPIVATLQTPRGLVRLESIRLVPA